MPSITITMSQQTIAGLLSSGYRLIALKAVNTVASGAAPLVWYQTTSFSTSTVLSWTNDFTAYASQSQVIPNGVIAMMMQTPVAPGQVVAIQGDTLALVSGGQPSVMSIRNEDRGQWTAGIAQPIDGGAASPTCAFPLRADTIGTVLPTQTVLLMFVQLPVANGTVLLQAPAAGFLVDLGNGSSATVSFSLDSGWSGNGNNTRPNANLVPLLI